MLPTMSVVDLPAWAQVTESRLEHIHRVTMLLSAWAAAMRLSAEETRMFIDAGRLHDAMRDAPTDVLRDLTQDFDSPESILHGPAAAILLTRDGENRRELLDAIRYHSVGFVGWNIVGKALYMADFLEPGRKFSKADRNFLATTVPHSFDQVFRQVVRSRLEWTLREGMMIFSDSVSLWNSIR